MLRRGTAIAIIGGILLAAGAHGEAPRLYEVATAHLDTQWRWTVRQSIEEYIPATLHANLDFIDRYPDYVFSFEGAFRYMLAKEYYPDDYARLTKAIAAGRWRVAGSWVDAVDTNIPAPESLIRQTLYGNGFFRREFGVTSKDVFLPDCFGFGFALPSIAAHSGLTGFSTQKLAWGSAYGIPFDVGLWEGVDGSKLFAALNPGEYVGKIKSDLSADSSVVATVEREGKTSGTYVAYKYFGTGDTGGGPTEESVQWLEKSIHGHGPVHVLSAGSDQMARDLAALTPEQRERLPQYRGELVMTRHGTGCYTSEAAMKRWNRRNEKLAEAAEPAAVAADWLGALFYPADRLRSAWIRFLWHQFHDDLTGTSIPEAYLYSWNDEAISQNVFADVLAASSGAVCRALDTRVRGVPIVVYNPLSIEREDPVEATVTFDGGVPPAVGVFDPEKREVPSEAVRVSDHELAVTFLARVSSLGWAVYDVRPSVRPCRLESSVKVGLDGASSPVGAIRTSTGVSGATAGGSGDGANSGSDRGAAPSARAEQGGGWLENPRYRVHVNGRGDIDSIFDRKAVCEVLAAPLRLELLSDAPKNWAAWEIQYEDLEAAPRGFVGDSLGAGSGIGSASDSGSGPAVRVVETGPARVALQVVRTKDGSKFRQTIRLGAGGAADRLEIATSIDWRTPGTLLEAVFPFAAHADSAVYDLGLGTIARGTDRPQLYEVPGQEWADLTGSDGTYGAAVLNDCKYGWDKPDDHTLRLTLLHTPAVNDNWGWIKDQRSMDLGHHEMTWAVCGHPGDWSSGGVAWQAERLNQPLRAFQAKPAAGPLGRQFSLAQVITGGAAPAVAIRALKGFEGVPEPDSVSRAVTRPGSGGASSEIVVRLQELEGRPQENVRVALAAPIVSVREVNGAEEPLCAVAGGAGTTSGVAGDRRATAVNPGGSGAARLENGELVVSFRPYQPRAFAIRIALPRARLSGPVTRCLGLPFDLAGITVHGATEPVGFDGEGRSLPGELLPDTLMSAGIPFVTGPRGPGALNVLTCRGQELPVSGSGERWNRLYLLAAAAGGDRPAIFTIDGRPTRLWIQDAEEPIGQWNCRLVAGKLVEDPADILPGYVKAAPVAWVGTHLHTADGKCEAYAFGHVFRYRIDLPAGARSVRLPDDPAVRLLAATLARNDDDEAVSAEPIVEIPRASLVKIHADHADFLDSVRVALSSPTPEATIRYSLDGSDPGSGTVYAGPFPIRSSCRLQARAIAPGYDSGFNARLAFTKLTLREPEPEPTATGTGSGRLLPGLSCRYFEGEWQKLPDFAALSPAREGVVSEVAAPSFARAEKYGLELRGYLRAPADGLYVLHLFSDDGSALWMGDEKMIDNDGVHGRGEVDVRIALKAGLHPIRIAYFQGLGDKTLELWWEGPGIKLDQVPAAAFCHTEAQGH